MAVLGELEQAVMDVLWAQTGALSVREVHARLIADRDLAYTTVMTVLDRLAKKGIVCRNLDGRAWHYRPLASRTDLFSGEILALLEALEPVQRREVWETVTSGLNRSAATGGR